MEALYLVAIFLVLLDYYVAYFLFLSTSELANIVSS